MGKATIIDEQGEGLYTVSLDYGSDIIAQRRAPIQAELEAFQIALDQLEPELAAANEVADLAKDNLDAAINALDPENIDYSLVNAASAALAEKGQEVAKLESRERFIKVTIANAEKRLAELDSEPVTETAEAWCATYTEGATGEVATIEIDGEKKPALIAPADPDTGGLNEWSATDGLNTNRLAMPSSATYLNTALLPGWQKWKPTYRVGVISNIDVEDNVGDVQLDAATSSAQDLDINQSTTLRSVPIEYLDCGAQVFEFGDRVVVQFEGQDWTQPKVIGFESNPRPCEPDLWASGNRNRPVPGGNLSFRLTARINPDTLNVLETYQVQAGNETADVTRIGLNDAAYYGSANIIRDAKTGASLLATGYGGSPLYSNEPNISILKNRGLLAITPVTGTLSVPQATLPIELREWPSGALIRNVSSDGYADVGATTSAGLFNALQAAHDTVVTCYFIRRSTAETGRAYWVVYDINSTDTILWQLEETDYGTDVVFVFDVAASFKYVAAVIWHETLGYIVRVRDRLTGSLVQTITKPYGSVSWNGVAIRGESVFVITTSNAAGRQGGIEKYDIGTGSLIDSASNIFAPYFSTDDFVVGDAGKLD